MGMHRLWPENKNPMALSHFSWMKGTGHGSTAYWAAFRACLRGPQRVFNNILALNFSVFFLSVSLALRCFVYICVYEHVAGRVEIWEAGGIKEAKDDIECITGVLIVFLYSKVRKILHFLWAHANLPPPALDSLFPMVSAGLHLALCSPSTGLSQIPIHPKSEVKRLTQSISHKHLGTWWNLNLIKSDKLFPKARWRQSRLLTTIDSSHSPRVEGDATVTPCLSQVLTESFVVAWETARTETCLTDLYACIRSII